MEDFSVWIANICILFTILGTIPSIWLLIRRSGHCKVPIGEAFYEDEDGKANEESTSHYSSTEKPFICVFIAIFLGSATAFAQVVFVTIQQDNLWTMRVSLSLSLEWLLFISWLLLFIHFINTTCQVQPVRKFRCAIYSLLPLCLLEILAVTTVYERVAKGVVKSPTNFYIELGFTGAQIVIGCANAFTTFNISRRPDVFLPNGRMVDRQYQSSLWQRFSFGWSSYLLDVATKKQIETTDLPALDAKSRSKEATARFPLKDTVPLWKLIAWDFRIQLLTQWGLITVVTILDVAPQYALLRLLRYLEARKEFDTLDPNAWFCVLGLFVATFALTLMEYRCTWIMWSDLGIPIRSILSSLVFEKMMKLKDGTAPASPAQSGENLSMANARNGEKMKLSHRQDLINLFIIDTDSVAILGATSQFYVMFANKFIITIAFLMLLIGWESLLAGVFSIVILFPLNLAIASRYGKTQETLAQARDKRTSMITEALQGIRQIKFSTVESQWANKIETSRDEELAVIWKNRLNKIYMVMGSTFTPIFLTVFCLATYAYVHGNLLPSVAFTALGLLTQLESLLGNIPALVVVGINARVSCERIQKFLRAPEYSRSTSSGNSISFHDASLCYPSQDIQEDRFILRNITVEVPNQALTVISGPTGSGKSLMLAAILGEADILSGHIQAPDPPSISEPVDHRAIPGDWLIPSMLAFVSQTPWIENDSIKNNILFGLPYDPVRYEKVLSSCALVEDLDRFIDKDQTEVGAEGMSLSSGQKWRLTLARALYSRAGILVIDDVFSALDPHVAKQIYKEALTGDLAHNRTRILATHHLSLTLPRTQYLVRLGAQGELEYAGSVDANCRCDDLEAFARVDKDDGPEEIKEAPIASGSISVTTETLHNTNKLVKDEARATGHVESLVYTSYLKATGGITFWVSVLLIYLIWQTVMLSRSWWVKVWTGGSNITTILHVQHALAAKQTGDLPLLDPFLKQLRTYDGNHDIGYYLLIYVAISLASVFLTAARFYIVYRGSLSASRKIFRKMTYTILRMPLRWFDTVPNGRILNRFTADLQSLDSQLAENFGNLGGFFFQVLGIFLAAFSVSRYVIFPAIILLVACVKVQQRYLAGARSIKRLESVQKSSMISHFNVSASGLSTLRAFSKSSRRIAEMHQVIDTFNSVTWHHWLFNNWVGFRLSLLGCFFASTIGAFVISTRAVDASLAGFALSLSLDFASALKYTIRHLANIELDMNAAERIFEYCDLEIEDQTGDDPPASWPQNGRLEVKDLYVGYGEELPAVLKGITFNVEANERIGIVGRTGAGKSTLSLALFRFLNPQRGSITIDGIDISKVKLHDLRKRLAIIPQQPVIFSGTIRSNIDPFDEFSDSELLAVLQRVHLIHPDSHSSSSSSENPTFGSSSPTAESSNVDPLLSLSSSVAPLGSNLSQGQKQLLCLARAMLSRPKILVLDEATSAVDMETDITIQRSICEDFANTTLIVIAHRLTTVADFSRILVIENGTVVEFGTPRELFKNEHGVFRAMVEQSEQRQELECKFTALQD